jgi:hypothetical protein
LYSCGTCSQKPRGLAGKGSEAASHR